MTTLKHCLTTCLACLAAILSALCAPPAAWSAVVGLSWDTPPAEQYIVAWRVYRLDPGGAWTYLKRVTAPTTRVEAAPGRCWRVVAVNVLGKASPPSEAECGE